MKAYLDNAATTPVDPRVIEAMLPYLNNTFGNPSSIHSEGRKARSAVETARKSIANLINAAPSEIFFTSGGTEADNTAMLCSVKSLGLKHIITSPIEHHAVLHTAEAIHKDGLANFHFVNINTNGALDIEHLETLLQKYPQSLVSLMHANNELGNINNIELISSLCKNYESVFHSDTVQTVGHTKFDLQKIALDFMVGAAHKFHGPKGVGFLYVNSRNNIQPFIYGGAQERNRRGGTENLYGIMGMAKALELAYEDLDTNENHIKHIKQYTIAQLSQKISDVQFNGLSGDTSQSINTVLNVSIPESDDNDMLLFNLDIKNICVSGGSACSSGTDIGSHVLKFLKVNPKRGHIRFSFSRFTTTQEIDYAVETLTKLVENRN